MLDTIQTVLIFIGGLCGLLSLYHQWQMRGPLTGTPWQRTKCMFGSHDYRLFAFTTDPVWRLIFRCHRCCAEHLVPDTHKRRVETDATLPPLSDKPVPGGTTRL